MKQGDQPASSAVAAVMSELEAARQLLVEADEIHLKRERASSAAATRAQKAYAQLLWRSRNVERLEKALKVLEGEDR